MIAIANVNPAAFRGEKMSLNNSNFLHTSQIIALLCTPGIRRQTVYKILNAGSHFTPPSSPRELRALLLETPGVSSGQIPTEAQMEAASKNAEQILVKANRLGIRVLTPNDSDFPGGLRNMPDPPAVIYIKGNKLQIPTESAVAVVGTREATDYGRDAAEKIGASLADKGLTVISGLAKGCDTAAHIGCLNASGYTAAVMAHGLDQRTYPSDNEGLARRILNSGGWLVSEYPPGTKACRASFVERDRLQSGMSSAVIVVETDTSGGTMHTVRYSLEQKRLLACVDHPGEFASDPKTKGNQMLIRKGAAFAINLADKDSLENFIHSFYRPRDTPQRHMKPMLVEDAHDGKVRAKLAEEGSNYIYVGRENKHYGYAASVLRNSHPIEKVGSREKSLELYQQDISAGIKQKGPIYQELQRLYNLANRDDDGKPLFLVCWCKKEETPRPKERFCHADIIRNAITRWPEIERGLNSQTRSERQMGYFEYRGPSPRFEWKGKYIRNWFSNMERMDKPLIIEGISYPTSEQALQAMKTMDQSIRREIAAMRSPYDAKRYWKGRQPRPDWDDVKLGAMREILEFKFAPGTSWHKKLMKTGNEEIVEYNNWQDRYWGAHVENLKDGTVHIHGKNLLGYILMEIRNRHRVKGATDRAPVTPKIFIGGSRSIEALPPAIKERIDNIVEKQLPIVIGDASGADTATQKYLAEKGYGNVTVFCTGSCRNNIGNWGTRIIHANTGESLRVPHEAKDKKMAEVAHFGFMAWDGKSQGTLNNVINLLSENKKSVVFFEPDKTLYTVGDAKGLSALMSKCDKRHLALFDQKLGLQRRLEQLQTSQEFAAAAPHMNAGTGKSPENDTRSHGYAR